MDKEYEGPRTAAIAISASSMTINFGEQRKLEQDAQWRKTEPLCGKPKREDQTVQARKTRFAALKQRNAELRKHATQQVNTSDVSGTSQSSISDSFSDDDEEFPFLLELK